MFGILDWFNPTRWIILAVMVGGLVLGYFGWEHHQRAIGEARGRAAVQAQWDAAKAQQILQLDAANKAAHEKELSLQHQKDEALHAAAEREKNLRTALAAARATGDGLRNDLAAARSDVSSASISSLRAYATTLGTLFGECTAEVERLAGAAAGHASDALTFENAWPK